MVTNLPAEAKAKWIKVMEAKTPQEKLKALEEFLSAVPKHKGTEKLIGQVRRQMAILRREIEEQRRRRSGKGPKFFVEKEGAAQIVLLGLSNSGKSTLLTKLTNAKVLVSPVPYSTQKPAVGMMPFEDIKFQLVEAPAIFEGASRGEGWGLKSLGLARNADAIAIVLDASNNPIGQLKTILKELNEAKIFIRKPKGKVDIQRKSSGGIQVIISGKLVNATAKDVEKLLRDYRIYHALVRIFGEVTLDDVESAIFESTTYKPAIVLLNKVDLVDREEVNKIVAKIKALAGEEVPIIPVSAKNSLGLKELGKIFFKITEIIRVYTKQPGEDEPSPQPLILKKGSTVLDVAERVHSRLYKNFKYAKIWGPSAKYPGERVGKNHVLMDGDIVEIHAKG
ncbi:MAG: GTP-binding protein [Desulfurococcales archaeon ex4484_217_2]|nr:MAG: GTP-binding protein [Desulfurococcales archaeon ex4484_217_2]